MMKNSNFFRLTPTVRVHSVLFFRVTRNRYKNRITIVTLKKSTECTRNMC